MIFHALQENSLKSLKNKSSYKNKEIIFKRKILNLPNLLIIKKIHITKMSLFMDFPSILRDHL